ncbi:hypothetical protein BJF79_46915 [Actinomadura sp. CNU-125]|uniref:hypothetical protein n=1 Tax=Actinomadura sp. CNU-125 TaxID=1904961 RepID=UPI00095FE77D|nr:hypothetical protein [Actinomadura sp. CNU-125]OLT21169.1 hypothetical protein BJF79_46915 [Actinomadura sp. CNU-125]
MTRATKGLEVKSFPEPGFDGIVQKWAKPPKPKKPEKPEWCDKPWGRLHPKCQDGGGDGGDKPACPTPISNGNCDPNKPPSDPPPDWWCRLHRGAEECRERRGDGRGLGETEFENVGPLLPSGRPPD